MKTIFIVLTSISVASLLFLILSSAIMTELSVDYQITTGLIFLASTGFAIKLYRRERSDEDIIELKPAFFLFTTGIFSAALGSHIYSTDILKYVVLFVAATYLLSGWYLFRGYFPEAGNSLLFFMGYAYSSIFCGFALSLFSWPFYNLLLYIGLGWSTILIILLILNWKKIPERGLVQLGTELLLMIFITFYHLFYMTHLTD